MRDDKRYWFPAKRYGWGWGAPRVWQGWAVIGVFAALAVLGLFLFPPHTGAIAPLVAWLLGLNLVLMGVCWWKGEPPRWRWGERGPR